MTDTAQDSQPNSADNHRMWALFNPRMAMRYFDLRSRPQRFAYYTNADTALKLLHSRKVWMRNATVMNDFREMAYGRDLLQSAFNSPAGTKLKVLIASFDDDLEKDLAKSWYDWLPIFMQNTYLTCVSEHAPKGAEEEDFLGRLSMWRAYGGGTGVAVVINSEPFKLETDALGAYTFPVHYASPQQFYDDFEAMTEGLIESRDFVLSQGRQAFRDYAFQMFRARLHCTKHPGFHEELEWRVVHNPSFDETSMIESATEVIGGVPQIVHKIPLQSVPERGLTGLDLSDLLDRVIIGPTNFAFEIRAALVTELDKAGVPNPAEKVIVSAIPLR